MSISASQSQSCQQFALQGVSKEGCATVQIFNEQRRRADNSSNLNLWTEKEARVCKSQKMIKEGNSCLQISKWFFSVKTSVNLCLVKHASHRQGGTHTHIHRTHTHTYIENFFKRDFFLNTVSFVQEAVQFYMSARTQRLSACPKATPEGRCLRNCMSAEN